MSANHHVSVISKGRLKGWIVHGLRKVCFVWSVMLRPRRIWSQERRLRRCETLPVSWMGPR